jgi:hypothetical protein
MNIATGLSATKTAFSLVKGVTDLLKRPEVDHSEVLARLMELQSLMLDAQSALADAHEENHKLRMRTQLGVAPWAETAVKTLATVR